MTDGTRSSGGPAAWGQITLGRGWRRNAPGRQEKVARTPQEQRERRQRLIEWTFRAFLVMVMVRISGGDADSEAARAARAAATASGDKIKQVAYAIAFFVFVALWLRLKGMKLPRCLSFVQYLLVAWILLSTTWAVDTDISVRRSVLLVFVFTAIAVAVDLLGPKRAMASLYWVLALCMTLSLCAIPFFSFAVHPPTEIDQSIVGGWRGIFVHKNTAGAIAGVSILVFLHAFIGRRKWYDALFFMVCLIFLIGSKSKTPALILPVAILLSVSYRMFYRQALGRLAFFAIMMAAILSIILAYFSYQAIVDATLANHDSFTGRAGLWRAVLDYSKDHRWLGSGYSSLWGTTVPPPIIPYTNSIFQPFMLHSHSGYLEMLGTTGVPGLVMAVTAAIIIPISQILRDRRPESNALNATVLAIITFSAFENFFETQLYTRDREIWVCFFIAILSLHLNSRQPRKGYRRAQPASASGQTQQEVLAS